jgi:D-3-phosphoglycerate dehydrogenase / 2-oxoglutarate reductase
MGKETFKILTLNNISVRGLERLPRDRYEVASEIGHPDAILLRSADMHEMDVPSSVKAVARAGAGTNNVPVARLSKRGIPVFNAPGANANAVKELVIAGMFLAARNICPAWEYVRGLKGNDEQLDEAVEKGKKKFVGYELPGRTLGVIGLGAIGRAVAQRARALGMRVLGWNRTPRSFPEVEAAPLSELLAGSDFVSVHVALVPATLGLLDAAALARMRPGAVLVNVARGGIVDEAALADALTSGRLAAAALDVFASEPLPATSPLLAAPNLVLTPHIGSASVRTRTRMADLAVENLLAGLRGERMPRCANPKVYEGG